MFSMEFSIGGICFIICTLVGSCYSVCREHGESTISRLQRDLQCGYDSTQRPPNKDGNKTKIITTAEVNDIEMDDQDYSLLIDLKIKLGWEDERLKWKPAEYGDTHNYPEADFVWKPKLGVMTMKKTFDNLFDSESLCTIMHTGDVRCEVEPSVWTQCQSDLTYWPYDSATCEALIAPWVSLEEEIQVNETSKLVDVKSYRYANFKTTRSNHWKIKDFNMVQHTESLSNTSNQYGYIELKIKMLRISSVHEATTVIPAIVLALLTVASSLMKIENDSRLFLLSTLLICHLFYLQFLRWQFHVFTSCPLIVLFYRNSMALCGLSFFGVLLLRHLMALENIPPVWITGIIYTIDNNPFGYFFLHLQEHTTSSIIPVDVAEENEDKSSEKGKQKWHLVGLLLDRIWFLLKSVAYFVMLIVYYWL